MDIQSAMIQALMGTGRISRKDRVEITDKTQDGNYARIGIYAYHGRKRTPFVYWNICFDMAEEIVIWDTSTFYYI